MNQFYMPTTNSEVSEDYLRSLGIPLDNTYAQTQMGIYPLTVIYQSYNNNFEYLSAPTYSKVSDFHYMRTNEVLPLPNDIILSRIVWENSILFQEYFTVIDKKCERPTQDILARQIEIKLLMRQPESEDAVKEAVEETIVLDAADEDYLLGLRLIQAVNRDRFATLHKATTWEEAKYIIPVYLPS